MALPEVSAPLQYNLPNTLVRRLRVYAVLGIWSWSNRWEQTKSLTTREKISHKAVIIMT